MKLRYWIIIFVLILCAVGLAIFLSSGGDSGLETEIAKRQNVVQEIDLIGRIKPVRQVDLAFEKSGKVFRVLAEVGDWVEAGDVLVSLTDQELSAQFLRNQATLEAERARLNELEQGTRLEELSLQEARVADSQIALQSARHVLLDSLQESFTKADDAVRNGLDRILDHPRGSSPQISFITNDMVLEGEIESERRVISGILSEWQESLIALSETSDLEFYSNEAQINLVQIRNTLDKASVLMNGASTALNPSISQSTIDGWRSAISAARTNINNSISSLTSARERLRDSEANLDVINQELSLKQAGTTEGQITIQRAKIKQVGADINNIQAQLTKTVLRSPISGVVTRQEAKVGQLAMASAILTSVISNDSFEIETNIPEADIVKVRVGNRAKITLDAYGPDIAFDAKVIQIYPAETIIDGVVTYKTLLSVSAPSILLKSGMTANIDLITAELKNVIAIPQRAVFDKDGRRWARLIINDEEKEMPVVTGVITNNGLIVIENGIREGDRVVTYVKD